MTAFQKFVVLHAADLADPFSRALVSRGPRKGQLKKAAPNKYKDPMAWACWQGVKTAAGNHTEGTTYGLMMVDNAAKEAWDRISTLGILFCVENEIYNKRKGIKS